MSASQRKVRQVPTAADHFTRQLRFLPIEICQISSAIVEINGNRGSVGESAVGLSIESDHGIDPCRIEDFFTKQASIKTAVANLRCEGRDVNLRCTFDSISENGQEHSRDGIANEYVLGTCPIFCIEASTAWSNSACQEQHPDYRQSSDVHEPPICPENYATQVVWFQNLSRRQNGHIPLRVLRTKSAIVFASASRLHDMDTADSNIVTSKFTTGGWAMS
jgi:hypothetical protein